MTVLLTLALFDRAGLFHLQEAMRKVPASFRPLYRLALAVGREAGAPRRVCECGQTHVVAALLAPPRHGKVQVAFVHANRPVHFRLLCEILSGTQLEVSKQMADELWWSLTTQTSKQSS